jgi:integrase
MMRFRKELDVHEINYSLMSEYEKYMRNEVKNKDSTIHRTIRRIHVVLNYLVKNEIIEKNPVKGFYVKDKPSMKVHLLDEELKAFEQLYHRGFLDTEEKKNVYSYFLFACYTGLRHSDINILKFNDIVMMKDKSCINLKMQKTKEIVTIPLIAKAKNLIGRYKGKDELVFDSYYNAKTNKILRSLIADARIDKHITFHSARHTFGTIAYNLGMPLGVIQKLMGHKNYKETLIYSKILDKTLFKEMEKME